MPAPMRPALMVIVVTSILLITNTASALGAVPTNDNYANAQSIALGAIVAIDTREATVEGLDTDATATCPVPPPATLNTIWFEFTADASTPPFVSVSVFQAGWQAGVAVVTGSPGAFTNVACGGLTVNFGTVAGTTYKILIFDFLDVAPNGGTAVVMLAEFVPPEISLTVDATGTFDPRTGAATITGTYQCSNALFGVIFVQVTQAFGPLSVSGSQSTPIICDGNADPWSALITPESGSFVGGRTMTVAAGFACATTFCVQDIVETSVLLRGR